MFEKLTDRQGTISLYLKVTKVDIIADFISQKEQIHNAMKAELWPLFINLIMYNFSNKFHENI